MIKYLSIILIIPIMYLLFLYFSYLDKTLTKGEGFGFVIGMSKEAVFDAAKTTFSNDELHIVYPDDSGSIAAIVKMDFSQSNLKKMKEIDYWRIYFGSKDSHSSISFSFKQNVLTKINRHRQYFELP